MERQPAMSVELFQWIMTIPFLVIVAFSVHVSLSCHR